MIEVCIALGEERHKKGVFNLLGIFRKDFTEERYLSFVLKVEKLPDRWVVYSRQKEQLRQKLRGIKQHGALQVLLLIQGDIKLGKWVGPGKWVLCAVEFELCLSGNDNY